MLLPSFFALITAPSATYSHTTCIIMPGVHFAMYGWLSGQTHRVVILVYSFKESF